MDFTIENLALADHEAYEAEKAAINVLDTAEMLEDLSKDLLAEIATEIEKSHTETISETKLLRLARCTQKWKNHQQGLFAARHKASIARVNVKAANRRFDRITSGLAYRRQEMARINV